MVIAERKLLATTMLINVEGSNTYLLFVSMEWLFSLHQGRLFSLVVRHSIRFLSTTSSA
jgi:hypothetical protein